MTGDSGRDELLTVDEVGAMLKVPRRWVYDCARRGDIASAKVGKYLRFRRRDVETFIDGRFTGAG